MRLFFAVEIPTNRCFHDLYRDLKEISKFIKPVDPQRQHITLKFLGDPGTAIQDIERSVSNIGKAHEPFDLKIDGSGAFPNWRKPSVIWLGLSPAEPLRDLAKDIDCKIHDKLGLEPDRREFRAHITVARLKGRVAFDAQTVLDLLEKTLKVIDEKRFTVPVKEFHLVNSTLTPSGPVYENISSFGLAAEKE